MKTNTSKPYGRITLALLVGLGGVLSVAAFTAHGKNENGKGNSGVGLGNGASISVTPSAAAATMTIGGSELAPEYYHIKENLALGDITFVGPTTIVADGDITISGNPTLTASAEVVIYFAGDFTMSGNASINNEGRPKNLKLYATQEFDDETMTDADRQRITMNGNVDLAAVLYAPEAIYTSNGGGNKGAFYGAILAYNATFNGVPGPFHYDESLADETIPNQPFSISGYRPIRDPNQLVDNDPNLGTYSEFIDGFFGG
ncbi:MAG: hypothetical protein AAFX93_12550 [Verrucomicrobiota bacterium]